MHLRYQGIEIGCTRDDDLFISDYAPPTTEMDTDRTAVLGGDGVVAGRDLLRDAIWEFTIRVNGADTGDVLSRASQLEQAWKDWSVRSGGQTPLEYSTDHGGTWHQVMGRPLRFTGPKADFMAARGYGVIDLQFGQLDPLHYRADESHTRVNVVASQTGTGFRAPLRTPVRSTLSGGEPRAGVIRNGGDQAAPVRVVFHGPCANPRVWADGFEAGYRGRLAHDQIVVLDGRRMTVMLHTPDFSPRHVPGLVTRKTRLSKLTAPVDTSNLWFDAEDPTGTSYVQVFWRDAFTSMQ